MLGIIAAIRVPISAGSRLSGVKAPGPWDGPKTNSYSQNLQGTEILVNTEYYRSRTFLKPNSNASYLFCEEGIEVLFLEGVILNKTILSKITETL